MISGNVIGVMTRHGEEFNEFHTRYHSIATYDMVQDSLALTFSFIIVMCVVEYIRAGGLHSCVEGVHLRISNAVTSKPTKN